MSETTKEKIDRLVAEAAEARNHPCNHCGHHGSEHAFDVYPVKHFSKFPCSVSCKVCFDEETKEMEKDKK